MELRAPMFPDKKLDTFGKDSVLEVEREEIKSLKQSLSLNMWSEKGAGKGAARPPPVFRGPEHWRGFEQALGGFSPQHSQAIYVTQEFSDSRVPDFYIVASRTQALH